jgi:RNA polymerase sigma factor (TIGR02999 family)
MTELSRLFEAVNAGDRGAIDRLTTVMYRDLHDLAHRRLSASPRVSHMETTGLVHESYLRFLKVGQLRVTDRAHFLSYSSRVMRSIIVDLVRKHGASRRGGDALEVTLNTNIADAAHVSEERIIRINDALDALGKTEPRLVQVVEMRYFGGLEESEIGEVLGVNERTVRRDWQKARLLLSASLDRS